MTPTLNQLGMILYNKVSEPLPGHRENRKRLFTLTKLMQVARAQNLGGVDWNAPAVVELVAESHRLRYIEYKRDVRRATWRSLIKMLLIVAIAIAITFFASL